ASSCAMRRNEDRAVSRATPSRSTGTGSAGRLTRVGTDAGLRLGLGAPARLNRNLTYEDSPPPWVTAQTAHGRYTPLPPEARPPGRLISSDFSRGFASCRSILAQQVLDPARGREPPRLVCLGQQPGDVAPQLSRLVGSQVSRQFVQQADELPDVGGPGGAALLGEPALELGASGAARSGAVQEVAQAVG